MFPHLCSPGPISQAFDSKCLISGNYLTTKPAKAALSCILINLINQDFMCVSVKSRRKKAQPQPFLCFMLNLLLLWGATYIGIKVNYFFRHLLEAQALSFHR